MTYFENGQAWYGTGSLVLDSAPPPEGCGYQFVGHLQGVTMQPCTVCPDAGVGSFGVSGKGVFTQ